jgi:hypothetical protein
LSFKNSTQAPGQNSIGTGGQYSIGADTRRYVREVFPTKSVQTRNDNEKELANLLKVFGTHAD